MTAEAAGAPAGLARLTHLAVLRIGGRDARPFLQGQLSQDVHRVNASHWLPAGLHNPAGRTLALLWLAAHGEDVLALVPPDLLATVQQHLRRYVLRARVELEDVSGSIALAAGAHADGRYAWPGERSLHPVTSAAVDEGAVARWRARDIALGLPQVYAVTSGAFVAQMLNLDCIDAISFQKGCYTGQEIIARAHYRGQVKRRLQRFRAAGHWAAGDSGVLADGRAFQVVDSVPVDAGSEFLAVAPLAAPAPAPDGLAAEALALPYALPD